MTPLKLARAKLQAAYAEELKAIYAAEDAADEAARVAEEVAKEAAADEAERAQYAAELAAAREEILAAHMATLITIK